MKYSMLFFFALLSLNVFPETQIETRIPLSIKGFLKLKESFPSEIKSRTDYYFNFFNGNTFTLFSENGAMKFRIKEKSKNSVLQVSLPIKRYEPIVCGEVTIFLTEKIFFDSNLTNSSMKRISHLVSLSQAMLQDGNSEASDILKTLEQTLFSQLQAGQDLLAEKIPASPYFLVPTIVAERKKSIINRTINNLSYEFVLKESHLTDAAGNNYRSFELEVETNADLHDLAFATCNFLNAKSFSASDIDLDFDRLDVEGASLKFYQGSTLRFQVPKRGLVH